MRVILEKNEKALMKQFCRGDRIRGAFMRMFSYFSNGFHMLLAYGAENMHIASLVRGRNDTVEM